jgi:hypothetical protein
VGQEFVIKSTVLEDKINQLLPSQGGAAAGVDLSASTTIIPIVDLTESAEGSSLRQDLQTAISFASERTFINNASNTVILNTTGFFRVRVFSSNETGASQGTLNIFDGTTSKNIFEYYPETDTIDTVQDDFIIFLRAGDSLRGSAEVKCQLTVYTYQIATITGQLVNPLGFTA